MDEKEVAKDRERLHGEFLGLFPIGCVDTLEGVRRPCATLGPITVQLAEDVAQGYAAYQEALRILREKAENIRKACGGMLLPCYADTDMSCGYDIPAQRKHDPTRLPVEEPLS